MDLEQTIEIPLKEYLELKELQDHKKEVKITEEIIRTKLNKHQMTGTSVSWKSDGKCWFYLAFKLDRQGDLLNKVMQERDFLKNATIKQFKVWKKGAIHE